MRDFVHLHLHTEYSLLDGMCRTADAARLAHEYRMPALAITDHGNMHGVVEFYEQALAHGIKPVLGIEMYMAPGSRKDREGSPGKDTHFHLTLLARNTDGYRNLIKLSTTSYLDGFYYRPRIDRQLLAAHAAGIIMLSGCLQGEVNHHLLRDDMEKAVEVIRFYQEILGRENFFLEMMNIGLPEQDKANRLLVEAARKTGAGVVATNDCHYLRKGDAFAHEVLLCIQTGTTLEDPKRLRFSSEEFYFKSPEEMCLAFREVPEAIHNTMEIQERCNVEIPFGTYHLPRFDPGNGTTPEAAIEALVRQGLSARFGIEWTGPLSPEADNEIVRRASYELDVIRKMGFVSYFLIIHDFVREARRRDITVGPGRGSAAGSLVSYLLEITDINPLPYDLLFERFLNPERISMPDIDIDFCDRRREEVIQYLRNRYGETNVAQIATFGTMAARAVIRDVGRTLKMSFGEVDRIAKAISPELGVTLSEELNRNPEIIQMVKTDERIQRLFDISLKLEGLARHVSIHAAGLVITEKPIFEYAPLFRGPRGETATQFDMNSVSKIGLLKVDVLGLKTLSVIEDSLSLVKRRRRVEIGEFPLDDSATYELLSRGESLGVFQLESRGMQDLLRKSRPRSFEDIIAILALYRPGPMKSGMLDDYIERKKDPSRIRYDHPLLEPILSTTYGIILYQEQVMQIAHRLGGFTMGEADQLRKAMGKKDPDEMDRVEHRFVRGAAANGVDEALARRIFDLISKFAGYGFNKSHSAGYALISYQTAYLKANYPIEFMTALLNSEIGDSEKIAQYVNECERMNIWVLPPDIGESEESFSIMGNDIVFGLSAIKNVGSGAIHSVLEAREKSPFVSLYDFCERVDSRLVNRKVLESFIKAGAFDRFEIPRSQMYAMMDEAIEHASRVQKINSDDQLSIFSSKSQRILPPGSRNAIRSLPEWPESKLLSYEKEMLGIYLTGHPLEKYVSILNAYSTRPLAAAKDGEIVCVGGLFSSIRRTNTRKGERMAVAEMETLQGKIEVVFYPRTYESCSNVVRSNAVLFVKGRLEHRHDLPKVVADEVISINDIAEKVRMRIEIDLPMPAPRERMEHLRALLSHNKGNCPVFLNLVLPEAGRVLIRASGLDVTPNVELLQELYNIFGKHSVHLGA